jgi:hypothetical protein
MPINERRIEGLVDALAHLKGSATNPDGGLYQIRNPIGMLSFSRPGKNEIDLSGRRIFKSWLAGYRAATYDVAIKVSGESRAGLKAEDKLSNLLGVYQVTEKLGQMQVVKFLRRALKDQTIGLDTPLTYFSEESK